MERGKTGNLQNCRISVFFLHSRHFSFSTSISRSPLFSADDVCHSNSNSSKKKSQALAESQKLAAGLAGLSGLCAPSATDFSGRKSVFCTLPLQSTLLLSSGAGQETSKWPSIHFAARQQSRARAANNDLGSHLHLHGTVWHYYSRVSSSNLNCDLSVLTFSFRKKNLCF